MFRPVLTIFYLIIVFGVFHRNVHTLNQARIINGTKVPKGKWPFVAAIMKKGIDIIKCGGSILNEDTILTAAHCLDGQTAGQLKVLIGVENIQNVDSRFEYQPKQLIMHENYTYKPFNNDIGIIKLQQQIDLMGKLPRVKPACFFSDLSDIDQSNCFVMGWGINQNRTPTNDLYELGVPILNDTLCPSYTNYMIKFNSTTMLCAGFVGAGRSHCKGDSGGPLVCPFKSDPEQYSQQGIVSNSKRCKYNPNFPTIFTRVNHYLDWIKKNALS